MNKLAKVVVAIMLVVLAGVTSWLLLTNYYHDNSSPGPVTTELFKDTFIDEKIANMTLRQKVASLLILHTPGYDATTLQNYLQTYQPAGLIFMGDNIPSVIDDLTILANELQINPDLPYLFAIDAEGGVVNRLSSDTYPAAFDLKLQPANATESAFLQRSTLLRQIGINLNFGIVADVTDNPDSFIYQRVFGGDPVSVGERVAAAVSGANGLTLSTLKHFPGHGETISDSHTSIPTTDVSYEKWLQNDEPPFSQGVKAGAEVVMFGHLTYSSVDSVPASLSVKWHQILSDQVGFTGLSITDDMIMLQQTGILDYADPIANAISALKAGNTLLLFVTDHGGGESDVDPDNLIDGIVKAVNDGSLSQTIIDSNVRQILTMRHSLPTLLQ